MGGIKNFTTIFVLFMIVISGCSLFVAQAPVDDEKVCVSKEKLNAVFIVILSLIPILVSWKIIHHKEWVIWILLLNQTVAITFILGFGGFVLNLPLLGLCVYWLISESKFLQH